MRTRTQKLTFSQQETGRCHEEIQIQLCGRRLGLTLKGQYLDALKKKRIETGVKMRQKGKKGIIIVAQRINYGQEIYVDVQKKC